MKLEYENDVVFGRYINYMKKALYHKKLDYIKHKKYLESIEFVEFNEECITSSYIDDGLHSFTFSLEKYKLLLKKLTPKQLEVMKKYYVQNKKIKEIAIEMKCSENAVKMLKRKVLKKFKSNMEEKDEK